VWRPDAFSSVCFLVASALAWFEVCHGWAAWRPRSLSWWITLLNLIGSVAFGVSAVAGYISPSTGQIHNAELTNLGTFVGALCFLAGALLLMPERTEDTSRAVTTPAPSST
jgi:peptidoglycan/LPS O-acetylase OafA/YrhL